MSDFAQSLGRSAMHTVLVAALFLLLAGQAMATPDATGLTNERWGEWRALSEGFVGRRREPPGLQRAVEERRLPEVQVQARLQERPGTNGRERAAQALERMAEVQAANVPQWAQALLVQQQSDRVPTRVTGRNSDSAWLMTGAPGLYSIPLDDIAAQAGMNIRTLRQRARSGLLSLLNDGEPVSWRYEAASDSLQFAAEAYETFYAEGNAYQLIFTRSRDGQQMSETRPLPTGIDRGWNSSGWNNSGWNNSGWNSSGWNNSGFGNASGRGNNASGRGNSTPPVAGQPTPFRDTVRFEEEPDMMFFLAPVASEPDADFWFWDYLWGSFQDTIDLDLELPDRAPNGVASLRVELRGWTQLNPGNEHQVHAELNGQPVGSVAWDGFDAATLVAQFDQGLLNANGSNSLRLRTVYPEGTTPGQFVNAIEFDYQRMPVAVGGELWLRGVAGGTQTVTGFTTSDVQVIESPLRNAALRSDARVYAHGSGWAVDFSSTPGADYLLVESPALRSAEIDGPATDNLRNRRNVADYLIIAPREFADTAEALAGYRGASFGAVRIAWLDDVYKEFGRGRVDPFAIGRFMQTVMNDWRQAPSMVVLVGKGSVDHKDRMGHGDSFIPVVMTSNPWALAPSDARLLGFENGITPFAYGRLAITNDTEGLAYVNKLSKHESRMRSFDWMATVAADKPDSAGDFHAHAGEMAERLVDLGLDVAWQYLHPRDDVRAALTSSATWNDSIYVSYDGHGSTQRLGTGNFLTVAGAENLHNEHLPVFTALTCTAGNDTLPGTRSLASALVLNPDGGAIASLAPTGLSLGPDAHILGMAFVDQLFGGNLTVGAATSTAKRSVDGRINGFMSPMYSVLGDPAARVQ